MRMRCRDGKKGIVLGGMLLMGATEVQSVPFKTRWMERFDDTAGDMDPGAITLCA